MYDLYEITMELQKGYLKKEFTGLIKKDFCAHTDKMHMMEQLSDFILWRLK